MLYGPGCEMVTVWVGSFPHTSTRMHPQLERAATKQTRCKLKEKKKKKNMCSDLKRRVTARRTDAALK